MNRFERVIEILNNAVGGPSAPVSFHGAFWRGGSRDEFVAKKVFGLQLITVGDGTGSDLVKALQGKTPFGADTGNPDADFNRMPSGLPPVSGEDIAFIQKWIDEGCLEDEFSEVTPLTWRKTNAPVASSRTDDIWFIDPNTGWAVNSDGSIIKTSDGGQSWVVQQSTPGVYLRCVGFANSNVGWVGTLTRNRRLFHTVDGGTSWNMVSPLPVEAPVAVCGLSVVSDRIVYASGTNRPTDVPRMMKTVDGGATWTAWDMSAHASILIDTYFVDALHGWVVGGKANEPTPTTRDKLKPVVLETTDGGLTWTNRLAGQEAAFPFGEWGWKIQFLNDQIGFVSLENFNEAAILKTTDGGQTWKRLKVNDPQGNVNLEGIGFIDEQRGWVGGWGPGGFGSSGSPQGFTSATTDGGENWRDANEIGLFINRFRFFGNPVHVGYASGDTVYKYSSDPVTPAAAAVVSADPVRAMLPESQLTGHVGNVPIRLQVPAGTKRLTLHIWNRFGEEVGCVLDEIRPTSGARVFFWDGCDDRGDTVAPGDYIVRLTADDEAASSLLCIKAPAAATELAAVRTAPRRLPRATPSRPRLTTIAALVHTPTHDLDWLRNALQIAIQLEFATLPPYLTARWTIKNSADPVANSIKEIRGEEMFHFALACNLLAAVDGVPLIADETVVPKYPGPLPGGVRPGLMVALRKLSVEQAAVFMDIEYPQGGPIAFAAAAPVTISEFYESILAAFRDLNPPLSLQRQLEGPLGLFKVDSLTTVEQAITLINLQGEGTNVSPEEQPGDLAHYYQFGEMHHGFRFVKDAHGQWGYNGAPLPMPEVHPMADIPAGGYQQADVPDPTVWELIQRFDRQYSDMLRLLQDAWTHGDPAILGQAVGKMIALGSTGRQLITEPRPDGLGNYGPCFRYVPLGSVL
jgi:photosystem II stability/assembly factor-like uncharacterized protein